ncbi:phage holin [Bifidobacterium pseudocatenulatum]|nr:phage holin [Bifidobacterium pseudocatenulatum]
MVGAVGPQWGLPHCGEIVTTINAVGLFVGALIGVSQLTAAKPDGSDEK